MTGDKLTTEQMWAALLAKFPSAWVHHWGGFRDLEEGWTVHAETNHLSPIGGGDTAEAAVIDAWEKHCAEERSPIASYRSGENPQ